MLLAAIRKPADLNLASYRSRRLKVIGPGFAGVRHQVPTNNQGRKSVRVKGRGSYPNRRSIGLMFIYIIRYP